MILKTLVNGGDEGDRTPDLLNAIQTRSQLRHAPMLDIYLCFLACLTAVVSAKIHLAVLRGIVPLTVSRDLLNAIQALSQLSYTPRFFHF